MVVVVDVWWNFVYFVSIYVISYSDERKDEVLLEILR